MYGKSWLSLSTMYDPEIKLYVIRIGSKCHYLLSHPNDPNKMLDLVHVLRFFFKKILCMYAPCVWVRMEARRGCESPYSRSSRQWCWERELSLQPVLGFI